MTKLRRWHWAVAASIASVGAAALTIWLTRPAQVLLSITPVRPLTLSSCAIEAHHNGYSLAAGRSICLPGASTNWYRAVLTNRGSYALVSCRATAYGSAGQTVFNGYLPFELFGIRGLFAPAHQRIRFYWYLPQPATGPVKQYVATCSTEPYP